MIKNIGSKLIYWIDERYDLTPVRNLLEHKKVPAHRHSVWYYMGGVTLFLFLVQLLTGILLLLYYRPGEESAYESVRFIVTEVKFGWLIRNVHSWSANLLVLFAFIHMFSVFFTKAYEKPRELTWITGFIILILTLAFGFSGYLLPWNELAYFATKVGTDIVGVVPIIGEPLKIFLRGGDEVTGATLSRFFGIHVAILPAIFSVLLGLHLLFIQRQGMHEPAHFKNLPEEKKKYISFFPDFALKDLLLWVVVFNILIFLALYFPWELGNKADAFASAPEGIKPEWYFMFMFQSLKLLPAHILFFEGELLGVLFFGIAGFVWMLVPYMKVKHRTNWKIQPLTIIGILIAAFIVIMTAIGYLL
ncbi:MAG: cytochrome b N-terminal domain-containing protein [Melioribacteraceae bacterium]